jgi:hypothetical protein
MIDDALTYSLQPDFRHGSGLIYYPTSLFQGLVHSGRFTVLIEKNFDSDVRLNHDSVAGQRVLWSDFAIFRCLIIEHPDRQAISMLVQTNSGGVGVAVAANDIDTAQRIMSEAKKRFPPVIIAEDQTRVGVEKMVSVRICNRSRTAVRRCGLSHASASQL